MGPRVKANPGPVADHERSVIDMTSEPSDRNQARAPRPPYLEERAACVFSHLDSLRADLRAFIIAAQTAITHTQREREQITHEASKAHAQEARAQLRDLEAENRKLRQQIDYCHAHGDKANVIINLRERMAGAYSKLLDYAQQHLDGQPDKVDGADVFRMISAAVDYLDPRIAQELTLQVPDAGDATEQTR